MLQHFTKPRLYKMQRVGLIYLLTEQAPRERATHCGSLKDRLGQRLEFQSAQRLAHAQMAEEAAQSGGFIGS